MRARSLSVLASLSLLSLASCVTRQDIRGIQTDLYNIQQGIDKRLGSVKDQTESVQTSQADLLTEMRELRGSLNTLQTDLADYQQRMSQLALRLDDLEASLTARMDSQIELLSGSKFVEKPLPSTVFNLANTDFTRGRYEEAIKGFESYVKQFPKGDRLAEAKLKLGDAFLKTKDTSGAIAAYDDVITNFSKHALASTALFRKAAAYESAGRKANALEAYSAVIKNYPYSQEAKSAQDRIRTIQSEPKQ